VRLGHLHFKLHNYPQPGSRTESRSCGLPSLNLRSLPTGGTILENRCQKTRFQLEIWLHYRAQYWQDESSCFGIEHAGGAH
jgi:hypothetical protein